MDINKIIDDVLDKELKEREIGHYYISEIPYCIRKIWYMFKKPKKFNSKTRRIFERGNVWHSWIANILKRSSAVVHHIEERSLIIPDYEEEFFLRGRVDDFIILEESGKKYILEIKTTANIWKQNSVSHHHLMQIIPYLTFTKNDGGKVIYIDTRYLEVKSFDVQFDWKIMKEVRERARRLHFYLKNNELPPAEGKEDESRRWECSFCLYQKECEQNAR